MELGVLKNTDVRSAKLTLVEFLEVMLNDLEALDDVFGPDRELDVIIVEKSDDQYGKVD